MFVSSSQNKNIKIDFIGCVVRVKYDNFCKTFGLAEIAIYSIHFLLGKLHSPDFCGVSCGHMPMFWPINLTGHIEYSSSSHLES